MFGTKVDLSDTIQQRSRQTRPKHHTYKDHVYLDRLFLLSNLTWRRTHVTTGLTGRDPNVNVNVSSGVFVEDRKLDFNLHISRLQRDTSVYISENLSTSQCSAFEIRLHVESSYIKTNGLFQYQTRTTEWFDIFFRMHFVRVLLIT